MYVYICICIWLYMYIYVYTYIIYIYIGFWGDVFLFAILVCGFDKLECRNIKEISNFVKIFFRGNVKNGECITNENVKRYSRLLQIK